MKNKIWFFGDCFTWGWGCYPEEPYYEYKKELVDTGCENKHQTCKDCLDRIKQKNNLSFFSCCRNYNNY